MYQSPIELFTTNPMIEQLKNATDEMVVRAVARADVRVDKEELIKALKYDREQYMRGFNDGIMQEREKWERKIRQLFFEELPED